MIYLLLLLSVFFASPAYAADTFREVLMQNAAAATGNGTAITVDYFTTVSVEVTITNTATITWEESITGSTWNTGSCIRSNDPATVVTTATTSGLYHCNLAALTKFRARISSYTSGTVTAYARTTVTDFDILRGSSSGAAGAGLTDAQLRATPVPVSGTVAISTALALDASVDGLEGGVGAAADAAATAGSAGSLSAKLRLITSQLDALQTELNQKTEPANTQIVGDGSGPLTVDGTVAISNAIALDASVDGLEGGVGAAADAAATVGSVGSLTAKLRLLTTQLDAIQTAVQTIDNIVSGAGANISQIAGVAPSVTNPLPTRDGNGTSFFSSDTIGANVYKKVSAVQDIELSSGNSSTANLASRAIFTGTSQTTLGVGAIQVNLYSDQPALIQVQQAQEDPGTGWNIVDSWLYMAGSMGSDAARTIQATGASTRVVVTNTGDATTTTFNLTTAMCPVCDSLPRGLTQAGNLKTAILEPTPILNALPVAVMRSAVPVPPVLPNNLNRLQYAASMRSYCMQTLCPPLPGGFK